MILSLAKALHLTARSLGHKPLSFHLAEAGCGYFEGTEELCLQKRTKHNLKPAVSKHRQGRNAAQWIENAMERK